MKPPALLLLDARGMLWRAHDTHGMLSAEINGEDVATGGMYGFLNIALRVHQRYGRPRLVVCWEGLKNFRFRLYPQYKGKHDAPTPERAELNAELFEQERLLIGFLAALGVEQQRCPGGEADDAIARLSHEEPGSVLIYSGDSDMRQLVDGRVSVAAPGRKVDEVYDTLKVIEKHGVHPKRIAALKALAGDTSDNIPGIKNIGPVAAVKLLNYYESLKRTLRAAELDAEDWPMTPRIRDLVAVGANDARLYFQLTNVRKDLPLEAVGERDLKPSKLGIMDLLRKYQFRSLASGLEFSQLMALGGKR